MTQTPTPTPDSDSDSALERAACGAHHVPVRRPEFDPACDSPTAMPAVKLGHTPSNAQTIAVRAPFTISTTILMWQDGGPCCRSANVFPGRRGPPVGPPLSHPSRRRITKGGAGRSRRRPFAETTRRFALHFVQLRKAALGRNRPVARRGSAALPDVSGFI